LENFESLENDGCSWTQDEAVANALAL